MDDDTVDRKFDDWAGERKLNLNSFTTLQLYQYRQITVQDYISQFRRGTINAILPEAAKSMSVENALKIGKIESINIRKLLIDNREKFQKR